jgi:hypothetical protein
LAFKETQSEQNGKDTVAPAFDGDSRCAATIAEKQAIISTNNISWNDRIIILETERA